MPSRFRSQLTWTAEEAKVEVLLSSIDVKSPNKYCKDIVITRNKKKIRNYGAEMLHPET